MFFRGNGVGISRRNRVQVRGGEDYRKLIANEGGHYNSTVPSWGGGNKVNFMVTHVTPLPPPPPSEVKYP